MKVKKFHIHIVSILLLFSIETYAQWNPCKGLEGGLTYEIIQSDSLFLTTCDYNIYRTTDDFNSSWSTCPGNTKGSALLKVDSCIISYGPTGLKRSFDNGITWQDFQGFGETWAMCNIGSTVFFDYMGLLFKSDNYFDSIEMVEFFSDIDFMKLYSKDSILIVLDYSLNAIYKSSDTANNWDTITVSGLPTTYASTFGITLFDNRIWLSGNYGVYNLNATKTAWIEIISGIPEGEWVYDINEYNDELYCCVRNSGLYKFSPSDSTWVYIVDSPKNIKSINEINSELFCGTNNGPAKMDSMGIWVTNYEGLYHRDVTSLSYINESIFVYANNELFLSLDDGYSFNKVGSVFGSEIIATDSLLYSLSESDVLISNDFGNTWDTITNNLSGSLYHFSLNDYYYFVSTSNGFYRSRIDTTSWIVLDNGLSTTSISHFETIDSVVIINDYHNHLVCISRNNGASFDTLLVTDGEYFPILKNNNIFYILYNEAILYSDDLGISWNEIDQYNSWSLDQNDVYLVVSSNSGPIEYINISYNNGSTWYDIKENLPSSNYGKLDNITFYNHRLFTSSTANSLWYCDDLLTSIFNNNKENLTSINTFPNPTSDIITIELPLYLKETNYNVYDIHGRLIISGIILDTEKTIDLKKLNSGIYIIEVYTMNNRMSKKIIKID